MSDPRPSAVAETVAPMRRAQCRYLTAMDMHSEIAGASLRTVMPVVEHEVSCRSVGP